MRVRADERARGFGSPGAHQPGEAEDLALAQLEADVLEQLLGAEAGDLEHDLAIRLHADGLGLARDLAADHHGDDLLHGRLLGLARAHVAAVADDRDAVGDPLDLVHAVRDVDHPGVGLHEAADQAVQDLDLGVVERRRRLVHDQQLGVVGQRLADLDHLLLGDREAADELLGPQRQMEALDQLARLRVEPALVEEEPRAARLAPDEEVLRDREVGHQVELLVDDADAELLRVLGRDRLVGLAVEEELALVGVVDAGQQLHQRRLAGAVLADQREDLAGVQVEVHVLERLDAGEALADALDVEEELSHRR